MYSIDWDHLNSKKKCVKEFRKAACFSPLNYEVASKFKDTKYIQFFLENRHGLDDAKLLHYYKWLYAIPEFKPMFLQTPAKILKDKYCLVDVTAHNGTRVFAFLTVMRAVIESPDIIENIFKFSLRKKYSWTKLGILKAVGSIFRESDGHWLSQQIDVGNVDKPPHGVYWKRDKPCTETGLGRNLHESFMYVNDGWGAVNPVYKRDLIRIEQELKQRPKNIKVEMAKQNMNLNLEAAL